ncbi:hypothetical protein EVAR_35550_1 [Eumeta japonica]|uniref:Uncharacterized protein n=1 Tax=Eumeta variegata TaxID=151549 RepID=A0A4C1X4W3_EUMVA|nr:hypothetical protein EVAR_35550_1 [Eumeta japonica]
MMTTQGSSRKLDTKDEKPKGQRDMRGWLVLNDGTQYLSAHHSIFWNKFSQAPLGFQALACCTVAVATSKLEDVSQWTENNLNKILDEGDKLYQDSFLHFEPEKMKKLTMEQTHTTRKVRLLEKDQIENSDRRPRLWTYMMTVMRTEDIKFRADLTMSGEDVERQGQFALYQAGGFA